MGVTTSSRWSRGLPPGARLGRYTVLEKIASGGMAELYLARQSGIDGFEKLVAIKRVLPHLAEDPDFVEMFRNEARLAATLDHPNIAQVFDVGLEDGEHFYAMEYVHGKNVLQVLKMFSNRVLSVADGLTIVSAVASALHHAHQQTAPDGRPMGIVHRDVTPSNVMISYNGSVKLTDFGIARAAERTSTTRAGTIKGKAGYMSPEQARGELLDRRSDVFSLGIMLYEVTTGVRAFYAPNDYATMGKVARGDYVPPRELDPDYPAALERIVVKALSIDPAQRYASAEALQLALEHFCEEHGARLSTLSLAEHMRSLFGTPPFPSIAVPLDVEEDDDDTATQRRSWLLPLAVGSGLLTAGVGLGALVFGGTEPAPTAVSPLVDSEPSAGSDGAVQAIPTVVPVPVEIPTAPTNETPPAEPKQVDVDSPAVEVAQPKAKRRKTSRRGHRKTKQKAAAKQTVDREALYPPGYE